MISETPKVVIDTNVLLTTINRANHEFFIYEAFRAKRFDWVVSTEILAEYDEQVSKFYSPSTASLVLNLLCTATNVVFAEPYYVWGITSDADDDKFSNLAISVNALCLVTYDRGFDVFHTLDFPKLTVVRPADFAKMLEGLANVPEK